MAPRLDTLQVASASESTLAPRRRRPQSRVDLLPVLYALAPRPDTLESTSPPKVQLEVNSSQDTLSSVFKLTGSWRAFLLQVGSCLTKTFATSSSRTNSSSVKQKSS